MLNNKNRTNKVIAILFLIFFYPFGIPYMWVTKAFSKKTSWIITLSFLAAIIVGLSALIFMTSGPDYIM